MKSIIGSQTFAAFLPLLLAGCAHSPEPSNARQAALEKPPKVTQSESATISKKDFEQIPKNLRPEDLAQRDDTSIIIHPGPHETIKEYRINGFLYSILVVPRLGEPYYLVAADRMGYFINPARPDILIPSWIILQWK